MMLTHYVQLTVASNLLYSRTFNFILIISKFISSELKNFTHNFLTEKNSYYLHIFQSAINKVNTEADNHIFQFKIHH